MQVRSGDFTVTVGQFCWALIVTVRELFLMEEIDMSVKGSAMHVVFRVERQDQ